MIHRAYRFARREAWTFARFLVVGGLSFLINIVVYALLSRVLFPQGNRVVESAVATGLSILFNFLAHRAWTYRADDARVSQAMRYGLVVGMAAGLQVFLFWLGHVRMGFNDFLVLVAVTVFVSMFTFFVHRFFTFRSRPTVV